MGENIAPSRCALALVIVTDSILAYEYRCAEYE